MQQFPKHWKKYPMISQICDKTGVSFQFPKNFPFLWQFSLWVSRKFPSMGVQNTQLFPKFGKQLLCHFNFPIISHLCDFICLMAFQQFPNFWEKTTIISQTCDEIGIPFQFPQIFLFLWNAFPYGFPTNSQEWEKRNNYFPKLGFIPNFIPKWEIWNFSCEM